MANDPSELVKQLKEMNQGLLENLMTTQQRKRNQKKAEEDFNKNQESVKESLKELLDLPDEAALADLLNKLK
jgi:hypothetical protein